MGMTLQKSLQSAPGCVEVVREHFFVSRRQLGLNTTVLQMSQSEEEGRKKDEHDQNSKHNARHGKAFEGVPIQGWTDWLAEPAWSRWKFASAKSPCF